MSRDGIFEMDMLDPMRTHLKKYGISETSKGVFTMDGENALCDSMLFVINMATDSSSYIRYLKTWILTTAGGNEDCKQEI